MSDADEQTFHVEILSQDTWDKSKEIGDW